MMVAKRRGMRKAIVALAHRLGVVMHLSRPFRYASHQRLGSLIEQRPHHAVAAQGYAANALAFPGLVELRRQSQDRRHRLGASEPLRNVDRRGIGERHHGADTENRHHAPAGRVIPGDREHFFVHVNKFGTQASTGRPAAAP